MRETHSPARVFSALGTGYALYKEDRYTLSERFDVRSGFVRVAYDVRSWLTVRARYCVENDDARTTHVFETGLRIRF